jgi:adenine-specific DNA-methyltransferase
MPSLNWIGKDAVVKHHKDVPFRLLKPVPALSCGDAASGNLIVQGDNLHALKALLPRYAGQVKCIYIDPPYNTGNEGWAYNDNVNSPEIRKWLGTVVGKEGETLDRHDRWLCMMYPRLVLLKQFLRDDGAIFVSIDDNEVGNLQVLMREIFGAANEVASIVWEKGKKGDSKLVSVTHEYIVVFARNKALLKERGIQWRRRKPGIDDVLGTADGQITAIFNLAAGDYSIFIGGADYASQPVVSVPAYGPAPAPNPTYDNYAFNAILSVPEPSTASQLLGAVACLAVFRRRRS